MFKFPYTNLHELNLDWILEKVKTLVENNDEFNDKADYAVETADEAKQIAEDAAGSVLADGSVTTPKIADYAVTQVKLAVNSVGNYQIQTGAVTDAKIAGGVIVRKNLLDNWYFIGGGSQQGGGQFPINQRGQTNYSGNSYNIDRWLTLDGGSSVAVNNGNISFSTGSNSDGLLQYFENIGLFHNKTLTVSALINGNLFTATGTSTTTTLITVDIDNDGSYLAFELTASTASVKIVLGANKTATITAVKLEIGSAQTLAHQENGAWILNELPNYADALARCQRYFVTDIGENLVGRFSGTDFNLFIPTQVMMAKNPIVQVLTNGGMVSASGVIVPFSSVSGTATLLNNGANLYCILSNTDAGTVGIGSTYSLNISLSADL